MLTDTTASITPYLIHDPKEEISAIISAFRSDRYYSHYADFVEFLFGTGYRTSEAIGLRWGHLSDNCTTVLFSQVPGVAWRMRTDVFKREVPPGSPLHTLLQRYVLSLFNQVAQSASCNNSHSIEKRFCRWILMTHDRVKADEFPLTHEFLAQMLGVRRAGVSEVAGKFQKAGIIRYSRGTMTILDRTRLEEAACECYAKIE